MLIQLPSVQSAAAGSAQAQVSMPGYSWSGSLLPAWDLVAPGYELLPKFNAVSARSIKK